MLDPNRDPNDPVISGEEWLFVKQLILHLDSVHRAMKAGMFVTIDGLRTDVGEFFTAPVPQAVWTKMKKVQDDDFIAFVESCFRVE